MFQWHVDTAACREELHQLLARIEDGLEQALDAAAHLGAQAAAHSSAFRDGGSPHGLRQSIRAGKRSRFRTFIEAGSDHALFIEYGTRQHGEGPYPIPKVPKPKGTALRFEMNGTVFFRRQVMHPGIAPAHFLRDAARDVEPELRQAVTGNTNEAIRRFNR